MTALAQMAAPARSGNPEARVPCPQCGGLVHPVAGRCKHCKQDLTTYRAGRPQAATPLPALLGGAPVAVAPVEVREESVPILPPRQSAHMPAARTHSTWKRWPVIVMVIAGVAIVGAVAVMFFLPPAAGADTHTLKPPPAPERMELNPIAPPSADPRPVPPDDPWGPGGQPAPQPHAQNGAPNRDPIDPSADPDDPDSLALKDPFANPLGNLGTGNLVGGNLDFPAQFGRHVCDRLAACGNTSQQVASYCNLMKSLPAPHSAPTCAAAKKCLDHIDALDCSARTDDAAALATLMTQVPDCIDAITRC